LTAAKSLNKAYALWPNHSKLKKMIANTTAQWFKAMHSESTEKSAMWLKYLKGILLIQPRHTMAIRLRREYIVTQRTELKAAYKQADYDKAIAAGMSIYFLDPNFSGIASLIGRCFFSKQLFPEALEWFIKAACLNPNDKNAWILRLRASLKANLFIEALSTIQQGSSQLSDDKDIITGVIKGALKEMHRLMEKDELEYAWQLSEALYAVCSQDKKVLKTRQLVLKKMVEQLKDAESPQMQIKMAKSIYEKDPNNIQALRIMAVSLMKQKKLEESLTYWEKLCMLFPEVHSYKMQAQKCIDWEAI
jgi:tetratricopeptide (TPR) repeat protein